MIVFGNLQRQVSRLGPSMIITGKRYQLQAFSCYGTEAFQTASLSITSIKRGAENPLGYSV